MKLQRSGIVGAASVTSGNASGAAALYGWWIAELARLAGPSSRSRQPWRGMLVSDGKGFEVYLRQGLGRQRLGRIDAAASADQIKGLVAQLRAKGAANETLVLRLPAAEVVATQLLLPAGVGEMLGAVVHNQLERVAPFPAEQARFAYLPLETTTVGAQPGQISVAVWVTARARVEEPLAFLAERGLTPGIVDAGDGADGEPRFSLIDRREQDLARQQRSLGRMIAAIAAVALVSAGAAFAWSWYLGDQRLAQEQAIELALRTATAAASSGSGARQLTHVLNERSRTPSLTVALEVLSRALPDQAHLERLELRNGILTVTGKAQSAADLIGPLEASRHVERVQFTAPTNRRDGSAQEDFALALTMKPIFEIDGGRKP